MDTDQQKHAAFEASPQVAELNNQLNNGLIALVEFAQMILIEWEDFQ